MTRTELEIIIVSYNSEFWLKKTLTTLYEEYIDSTHTIVQVTVVDNGSTDDSVQMLKKHFPQVRRLIISRNMGFGYANNQAIAQSKAPFVMLLNSDMELTADSRLDTLLTFMKDNPKVGIITPRVQFTNGSLDPACHRGEPTLWSSFTYFTRLEKFFGSTKLFGQYHQGYKNLDTIHTVDACSGAAMIIRRKALDSVGLFDERFFMYAEDLDLCKRFREHQYLIVYHPGASIIHHKYKSGIGGTSKIIARSTRKHFYDTMLQYFDKHYRHRYPEFVRSVVKGIITLKKGAQ